MWIWALLLLMCGAAGAREGPGVPVRVGDHPGFGRVVFDWPAPPAYRVERDGDRILVRFPTGALGLGGVRRMPRNVLAMRAMEGGVEITVAPGARLRHFRNGTKVAFDVMDAAGEAVERPARVGRGAAAVGASRLPGGPTASPAPVVQAPQPGSPPQRSSAVAPAPDVVGTPIPGVPNGGVPVPLAVMPAWVPAGVTTPTAIAAPAVLPALPTVSLPPPPPPPGLLLPFSSEAGAAMLRRGDAWLIVFDAPPDMPGDAVARPGVAHRSIPGGALVTLDATAEWAGDWHLTRSGADGRWRLAPGDPPVTTPVVVAAGDGAGGLVLPAVGARRALSVQDPVSGLPLLIGTQAADAGLVMASRDLVELRLLETRLGVAVLARSDAVVLRVGTDRFVVAADGGAKLAFGGTPEPAPAVSASRSFDFPTGDAAGLAARLRAQQAWLAQAPPLARGGLRLAAAETLMALGQPQEAQAMIELARQEDPTVAASTRATWLAGAAALAAGRPEEAAVLLAVPISDETALWRGLLQARQGDAAAASEALSAGRAILLGYPEALLRRVLPQAAEALAMVRPDVAAAILAEATIPGLDLARAALEEAQGRPGPALEAYGRLAQGRDRRDRAEALRRAAELRLSRGELDPRAAAQALEQTLFAWRDEAAEFETRRRIAVLRALGGDGRGALALLRETAALFPDRAAVLDPAMRRSFAEALAQETPLGAVALHDANPELLPAGAEGVAALAVLAERLMALDLPGRALTLLRDAMQRAPAGEHRAALGARLAHLHLSERENAAAATTLAASAAPDLPDTLRLERAILAARATGRGEAFAALGEAGDEALAEFLADRRDFAGAAAALGRHLNVALRGLAAPLAPQQQRAVVRHAALLALAGDHAGLGRIRGPRGALLVGTPAAAPFQLLVTDPVSGLADLARVPAELELFRTLPSRLDMLRTARADTR